MRGEDLKPFCDVVEAAVIGLPRLLASMALAVIVLVPLAVYGAYELICRLF